FLPHRRISKTGLLSESFPPRSSGGPADHLRQHGLLRPPHCAETRLWFRENAILARHDTDAHLSSETRSMIANQKLGIRDPRARAVHVPRQLAAQTLFHFPHEPFANRRTFRESVTNFFRYSLDLPSNLSSLSPIT